MQRIFLLLAIAMLALLSVACANDTTSNTTNNAVSNSTRLPQTGSNTEIIFIIGITVLAGTAITLYNKTKIK